MLIMSDAKYHSQALFLIFRTHQTSTLYTTMSTNTIYLTMPGKSDKNRTGGQIA